MPKPILQPAEGEVLKLGPPAAGEVVIKVDSQQRATPFAAGTETLLPGAEIPSHRQLHRDTVLFVHKGQGRAVLDGQSMTVVPGTMVFAPKASWYSLRNTGTGLLQLTWLSAPGGIEAFFRELSKAGTSVNAAALQELAQHHGIELGAEFAAAPAPRPGRSHRRRRGGRRGGSGLQPAAATSAAPPSQRTPSQPPPGGLPVPSQTGRQTGLPAPRRQAEQAGGRRRRHRGRGGSGRPPAQQVSAGSVSAPRPPARRAERKGGRPRRFGRVKEVYMGGKWVRVVGEGPIISGESSPEAREESDT